MRFVIEPRPYSDPDVVRLVAEVQQLYVEMYGGPDAAAVVDDEFSPPQGLMLVGLLEDVAVAMGGWRRLPDGSAEIKRMYVSVAAQRRGLGRLVLAEVERTAAAAGVEQLVLNTGPHQHAAIALYEAEGYRPYPAFGHYADHGDALFFAKPLGTGAVS
ncbi:GNAT family N-acetyltransferase [Jatrophihabitans endophyticus]|uniref:GNAT family N-acetyltransferase n=1 Tax=Jatrophihabitans endophyticus TaxID=1206085 RepID=UPI001F1CCA18|nr:GNAT family N-acetyltransferase [Jatrophihabitans endophyticus]